MPTSTGYFKQETKSYITSKYSPSSRILDVGAGQGTYADLLEPEGFNNLDCVEVFEPYIKDFKLSAKYKSVFHADITTADIDFSPYDLIILGDVLEHIEEDKGISLLDKLLDKNVIVAIPFDSEQGVSFDNEHEIHLQSDLNFINFFNKYKSFYPLCVRHDYGIFVREPTSTIYIEVGEKELPKQYELHLDKHFNNFDFVYLNKPESHTVTIVTSLLNLGRGSIGESFKRQYDSYLEKFAELLKTDIDMYIFADPSDEEFIWKHRDKGNTVLNLMGLEELEDWFNFTDKVDDIRKDSTWLNQSSWLKDSPQATLRGYNALVMSKMFMLNNVTIFNPFNSEYFFWIDAGITNTVHYGYFTHDKVFDNLPNLIDDNEDFLFLTYPYDGGSEIHGFEREAMARYSNTDYVKFVCRGGFFGGKKERINHLNGIYYQYLNDSLNEGLMGTEESIFTIMMHNFPNLISQYMIGDDGLVWPFFESLKDSDYSKGLVEKPKKEDPKIALYVITFNFPEQFEKLIQSFKQVPDFFDLTEKYVLDNSTDETVFNEFERVARENDFTLIKKNNIGICGGRQFIAEHFDGTDSDYMLFFEDDMFLNPPSDTSFCKNGFRKYIDGLLPKSIKVMEEEGFDFLKLCFTEVFGDNKTQWAWYNVPQDVREKFWPDYHKLPEHGLDPNAPLVEYKHVKQIDDLTYATGDIYYANWPQIVSKEGNKKMFLNTKWAHPYEQTWMSFIFQESKKGDLNAGILLASPITHDRFKHYDAKIRVES